MYHVYLRPSMIFSDLFFAVKIKYGMDPIIPVAGLMLRLRPHGDSGHGNHIPDRCMTSDLRPLTQYIGRLWSRLRSKFGL